MSNFLRQATASQSRSLGPFVDDTDFKTTKTGLTIANTDIKLVVNGGASADKNSGGGTHRVNGIYGITFDATDTATVGEMEVSVVVAGALPVFKTFFVVEEAVYDALYAASAPGYVVDQPVNVTKVGGTTQTAGDIYGRIGDPVGSPTQTITRDLDNIWADTNDIQSRLPAALVSGRLDVSVGAMQANVLTATAIAADAITDAKVASDVTIASVTGAVGSVTGNVGGNVAGSVGSVTGNVGGNVTGSVGSVTGNVGGNVTGSVGSVASGGISSASFAAGAINAAAIATDAIDADALAADAVAEIQSGLSTLDAAGVRSAVGLASANLDTQLAGIDSSTDILASMTELGVGSPQYYRYKAEALEQAPTGGGASAATIADAVWDEARAGHVAAGSFGEGIASVQGNVTGSVASVSGNVGGNVAGSVGSVTGNVGGNVTGSVGSVASGGISAASFAAGAIDAAAIATDAIDADALKADAVTEIQSGLSTLNAAGVRSAIGLASANLDTQLDALPTAAENADKLLGRSLAIGADGGRTVQDALRSLRNKSEIVTGTLTVYEEDDTTTAWTAAVTTAAGDPLSSIDPA